MAFEDSSLVDGATSTATLQARMLSLLVEIMELVKRQLENWCYLMPELLLVHVIKKEMMRQLNS
jgi:hypothetical protein